MVDRYLSQKVKKSFKEYPVVSVQGPRQSGKTTLIKNIFPNIDYYNLEDIRNREFATSDPIAFINQSNYMILDEVQNVPDLFSQIQVEVDKNSERKFILSGSQNLVLSNNIKQTLAGRISIHNLFPLTLGELKSSNLLKTNLNEALLFGAYPRIYDQKLDPVEWLANYVTTYLDRGVASITDIRNLIDFRKFLKILAGRVGQVLNSSAIASDTGLSVTTINRWISILEKTYIVFRLEPFSKSIKKRLTKSSKIYFYDTGLLCSLMDIQDLKQLEIHPLIGQVFENFVISDFEKIKCYDKDFQTSFYRDKLQKEVDLIIERNNSIEAIEIKYAKTYNMHFIDNLLYLQDTLKTQILKKVIYGGDISQKRTNLDLLGWQDIN